MQVRAKPCQELKNSKTAKQKQTIDVNRCCVLTSGPSHRPLLTCGPAHRPLLPYLLTYSELDPTHRSPLTSGPAHRTPSTLPD